MSAATGGRGLIPATWETTASVSHFYFMERDDMTGITTSNAHFFELYEIGPDVMFTVEP